MLVLKIQFSYYSTRLPIAHVQIIINVAIWKYNKTAFIWRVVDNEACLQ